MPVKILFDKENLKKWVTIDLTWKDDQKMNKMAGHWILRSTETQLAPSTGKMTISDKGSSRRFAATDCQDDQYTECKLWGKVL